MIARYDVETTKMLPDPCVLQCFIMVEVKHTRDSRQHRFPIIDATTVRELHFNVFGLNFKKVLRRVRLRKHRCFDEQQALENAIRGWST